MAATNEIVKTDETNKEIIHNIKNNKEGLTGWVVVCTSQEYLEEKFSNIKILRGEKYMLGGKPWMSNYKPRYDRLGRKISKDDMYIYDPYLKNVYHIMLFDDGTRNGTKDDNIKPSMLCYKYNVEIVYQERDKDTFCHRYYDEEKEVYKCGNSMDYCIDILKINTLSLEIISDTTIIDNVIYKNGCFILCYLGESKKAFSKNDEYIYVPYNEIYNAESKYNYKSYLHSNEKYFYSKKDNCITSKKINTYDLCNILTLQSNINMIKQEKISGEYSRKMEEKCDKMVYKYIKQNELNYMMEEGFEKLYIDSMYYGLIDELKMYEKEECFMTYRSIPPKRHYISDFNARDNRNIFLIYIDKATDRVIPKYINYRKEKFNKLNKILITEMLLN